MKNKPKKGFKRVCCTILNFIVFKKLKKWAQKIVKDEETYVECNISNLKGHKK
jgi:hypothetical protein